MQTPSSRAGSRAAFVTAGLVALLLTAIVFAALFSGFIRPGDALPRAAAPSPSAAPAPTQPAPAPAAAAPVPATPVPSPTPGNPLAGAAAPSPVVVVAPAPVVERPSVAASARAYLEAWRESRYGDMYRMLSSDAQTTIDEEAFVQRYRAITSGSTIARLVPTLSDVQEPTRAVYQFDVDFSVSFETSQIGQFAEQYTMPLVFESDSWRVAWTPDLIFPGLAPDRRVRMDEEDPARGAIVDRNGEPLATHEQMSAVGVVPGALDDRAKTVRELAVFLNADPAELEKKVSEANPSWWVPLGRVDPTRRGDLFARFGETKGVEIREQDGRVYPHGETAAHIVGYVSPTTAEDIQRAAADAYAPGDVVGRTGIEASQERELAGIPGGRLSIVDPTGALVRVLAERPSRPGRTVQLTIDVGIQKQTEAVLGERPGSVVLLDPRDNGIIAMASYPRFNPNGFVDGFPAEEWKRLTEDPRQPFHHRPAMSAYPTGSIFKVITMAAGLERGGFRPDSGFNCGGSWNLPGTRLVFGDWVKEGHGPINLSQGLVESCNIVFYELGRRMYGADPNIVPFFAHQFGLGAPTGVVGLTETAGIVPNEEWKQKALGEGYWEGDAINFAIGQGFFQATPLQMANAYSTLASGGLLRTPVVIKRIGPGVGRGPFQEFHAQERHRIPVSPENLAAIKEAMQRVTQTPQGTGFYAFQGYKIPTAGKTGSAENQFADAHAWFAGYGPVDNPQVVVIAMVEGGKLGGVVAAPLGRKAFEIVLGTG